jgi:hypothetical protein
VVGRGADLRVFGTQGFAEGMAGDIGFALAESGVALREAIAERVVGDPASVASLSKRSSASPWRPSARALRASSCIPARAGWGVRKTRAAAVAALAGPRPRQRVPAMTDAIRKMMPGRTNHW